MFRKRRIWEIQYRGSDVFQFLEIFIFNLYFYGTYFYYFNGIQSIWKWGTFLFDFLSFFIFYFCFLILPLYFVCIKLKSTEINMLFDKLTLGNQPHFEQTTPSNYKNLTLVEQKVIQDEYLNSAEAYQAKMELRLFSVSLPDLLYSIVFMIYIFYLRVSNERQIKVNIYLF